MEGKSSKRKRSEKNEDSKSKPVENEESKQNERSKVTIKYKKVKRSSQWAPAVVGFPTVPLTTDISNERGIRFKLSSSNNKTIRAKRGVIELQGELSNNEQESFMIGVYNKKKGKLEIIPTMGLANLTRTIQMTSSEDNQSTAPEKSDVVKRFGGRSKLLQRIKDQERYKIDAVSKESLKIIEEKLQIASQEIDLDTAPLPYDIPTPDMGAHDPEKVYRFASVISDRLYAGLPLKEFEESKGELTKIEKLCKKHGVDFEMYQTFQTEFEPFKGKALAMILVFCYFVKLIQRPLPFYHKGKLLTAKFPARMVLEIIDHFTNGTLLNRSKVLNYICVLYIKIYGTRFRANNLLEKIGGDNYSNMKEILTHLKKVGCAVSRDNDQYFAQLTAPPIFPSHRTKKFIR